MHAALLIALASVANTQTVTDEELRGCTRLSQDDAVRLACFDRLAKKLAPPAPVAAVDNGKWSTDYSKSEMDDSTTVLISLDAEKDIRSWPNNVTRPTLMIRCKENATNAYIVTGTKANPELGNYNSATARMRLDDGPTQSYLMSESTDGEALFLSQPIGKLKQWEGKKKLTFEFTPFNSSPQATSFAIVGIENALKPVRKACKW